ncbi:aqualysin-1-like [Lytechinus pictus]|uniref:aqualysin-1-like n=1 Tax=Lytechinus pictus TaxID=7653 RepID=UPI0030BA204A
MCDIIIRVLLLAVLCNAEIAPLLKNAEPIPGKYIVRLKDGFDVDDITSRVRLSGGRVRHTYRAVFNGFAAELNDNLLETLRNLAGVEYVEEDGVYRAQGLTWGLDRIDQRKLPLDLKFDPLGDGGEYYTVYVLDTGIRDTHGEFEGRAEHIKDLNFAGDDKNFECNGHGTHCAGIVGSINYGVAKKVQIKGIKVLSCEGYGSVAGIIAGCDYVMTVATRRYSVVSMSIGGGYSSSFNDAINELYNVEIPAVVSAGNDNKDACLQSPASAEYAITVGATDDKDTRSSFSNYGKCVDIFAPGTWIESTWYTSDTSTYFMSGTSMACPHVAGAVTLFGNLYNMFNRASINKITNIGDDSPNLLLYVGKEPAEPKD